MLGIKRKKLQKQKIISSKPLILALLKKEKSKSKSLSCTRNTQNNKLKANKAKLFISMNQDPEKSGMQDKKFHQSLYTFDDTQKNQKIHRKKKKRNSPKLKINKNNKTNHSQSCILKNDIFKKREISSALQVKKKSRQKLIKISSTKIQKKNKQAFQNTHATLHTHSIITQKQKKFNSYNSIKEYSILALQSMIQNPSNLISVTTSGQIAFSSQAQSHLSAEKENYIYQKNSTQLDPNALLKQYLKKEYNRKVAAITKIQKIWRGYQTRKLLKQYIIQEQPKLVKLLSEFKNNSSNSVFQDKNLNNSNQQIINQYQIKNIENVFKNHIIQNIKNRDQYKKQTIEHEQRSIGINLEQQKSLSLNTNKESFNFTLPKDNNNILDELSAIKLQQSSNSKYVTFEKISQQEQKLQQKNVWQPQEFEFELDKQKQKQKLTQKSEEQPQQQQQQQDQNSEGQSYDSQDQDQVDLHIYKRQKPIFSHQDLHDYLKQTKYRQLSQQYEQQQKDIHQPRIILQTSQQYIQTRKTSMANKKLSKFGETQSRKISHEIGTNQILQNIKSRVNSYEEKRQNTVIRQIESLQQEKSQQNKKIDIVKKQKESDNRNDKNGQQQQQKNSTKQDYKQEIIKIKNEQILKWGKMIEFIKNNIKGNHLDEEYEKIMNEIVQQSEANKKQLEKNLIKKQVQTLQTRLSNQDQIIKKQQKQLKQQIKNVEQNKKLIQKSFKKKNLELDLKNIQNTYIKAIKKQKLQIEVDSKSSQQFSSIKIQRNWNLPNLQTDSKFSKSSNKINTKDGIKNLLSKKLNNFSTANLNDIISIRQQLLKQRQAVQYQKLNVLLLNQQINSKQYEDRKKSLQDHIQNQKLEIEKARLQIQKGLKVAAKVVAKTQRDAQILGKTIGMSKSQQNFSKIKPEINHLQLIPSPLNKNNTILYIDQKRYNKKQGLKNFFNDESKQSNSSQNSSLDLTEQEIMRFKDPKFINLEFADLNKNIMISEQFLKSHKINSHEKPINNKNKIQINEQVQDQNKKLKSKDPKIQEYIPLILQQLFNKLLVEICFQFYQKQNIFQTINMKFQLNNIKPPIISQQQIILFLDTVQNILPQKSILLKRLNQKISPSPLQLLKCMRVDLNDQSQIDNQNDQTGKYQFIIPQNVCTQAITKIPIKQFQKKNQQISEQSKSDRITLTELPNNLRKIVQNRQKILEIKRDQAMKKKGQVFNILMHCFFDSWNQQIITLKTIIPGFSGIGLNQSTLSLQNQNIQIQLKEVDKYIDDSKEKVIGILTDNSEISKKINNMAYEQMCYNESNWINYTDQALGYFLELDYIIVQQLMGEVARFLQKKIFKQSMFNVGIINTNIKRTINQI